MATGPGSKPPSVPIWMMGGPAVRGSGTPPSRPSVGQVVGQQFGGRPVLFTGLPLTMVARASCAPLVAVAVLQSWSVDAAVGGTAGSILTSVLIEAIAVAPMPPPPVKVTAGFEVQPEPGFVTITARSAPAGVNCAAAEAVTQPVAQPAGGSIATLAKVYPVPMFVTLTAVT